MREKRFFKRNEHISFFLGKSRSLYADLQRIAKMLVCEVNKSVFIYLLFIGFSFFLSRFGLQKIYTIKIKTFLLSNL